MGAVNGQTLAADEVLQGQLDQHVRTTVEPERAQLDGGQRGAHVG